FGILFIDIDRLKNVNDRLGHAAGDQLLRAIVDRMKACVRKHDTLARLGGDEFVCILADLHQPLDAEPLAAKFLQQLSSAPFCIGGHRIPVTASIGISIYPTDGLDPESLIHKADSAMYLAKNAGRNRYRFVS